MEGGMDAETQLSLLDHYRQLVPMTSGRMGSLTSEEAAKLQRLWRLLLREFNEASSEPLPVLFSLAHPQNSQRQESGENGDEAEEDITALSFEPLDARSSRAVASNLKGRPRSNKESPSGSGGWFGWGSKSLPSSVSATPASSSGASTPTAVAAAENSKESSLQRTETVEQRISRTASSKGGSETPLVPPGFEPLFGQPPLSRSFRAAFWQAATQIGDPDSWVLRFLRARKWDPSLAFDMIKKTIVWRVAQAIDEVAYFGESRLHYHTMDTGLAFACTEDRLGSPVYLVRVRMNVARNRNILAIKRFLCWQIETSQLLADKSDGRVTILFDLTGFTRENIDIKLIVTLISLLTNYYPETLGILILHVNSWIFSGIWSVISPFIDPVVKSKIVMAKSAQEIAPYIDLDSLPGEVGGKKQFDYKYILPTPEESACMADAEARRSAEGAFVSAVDRYEQETRRWLEAKGDGVESSRRSAKDELRTAAVNLDPYVRAHTLYSRLGFIKPDRSVSF